VFHICRIRIFNPIQFTISIPNETGSRIDEAFRQIEDEQVVALTSILPQMTVAQAILNIGWINAVLFKKVCRRIGAPYNDTGTAAGNGNEKGHSVKWGIDLEGTAIKPIEFNRGLNKAITGVAEATFGAVSTVRTAEADRQAAILAGQGTAQAAQDLERQTLEGRAAGLAKVAEVLGSEGGKDALAAEVARSLGASGNTIVVGTDGVKEIIGLATAARRTNKEN
jgi:regulator of protease activity HflC (stomatin/prohibitin superfamily)